MQAGASAQFSGVPLNLVAYWVEIQRLAAIKSLGESANESMVIASVKANFEKNFRMDYLVTGSWSLKASQEAALLFEPLGKQYVNIAIDSRKASSDGKKFGFIPTDGWTLSQPSNGKPSFVYYCDNETVDGVEFPGFPTQLQALADDKSVQAYSLGECIIVADMSSNILSRPVDVSKYGVLFFGAQKNISSAGLTVAYVQILSPTPSPLTNSQHHPQRHPHYHPSTIISPRPRNLVPTNSNLLARSLQSKQSLQHPRTSPRIHSLSGNPGSPRQTP